MILRSFMFLILLGTVGPSISLAENPIQISDGIYEFKSLKSDGSEAPLLRILLLDNSNYVGFPNTYDSLVPTPIAWWNGVAFDLNPDAHVQSRVDISKSEKQLWIQLQNHDRLVLQFENSVQGGKLFIFDSSTSSLSPIGNFELTSFIPAYKLNLSTVRYKAALNNLDFPIYAGVPSNCPKGKYIGEADFLRIPKQLTPNADGWVFGMQLQAGSCTIGVDVGTVAPFRGGTIGTTGEMFISEPASGGRLQTYEVDFSMVTSSNKPGEKAFSLSIWFEDPFKTGPKLDLILRQKR